MAREDFFASTDWLAANLDAPDVVAVDGTFFLADERRNARNEFEAAHIPGAVFFDIDAIADHTSSLPHMLPRPDDFAAAVGALGLAETMRIVVYDATGLRAAPRLWWTLRTFGATNVKVLDGGLPAWRAEGRPLESGVGTRPPQTFHARFDAQAVASRDMVRELTASHGASIVDARAANRFRGDVPEPRPGLRAGHIPGSRNIPWDEVTRAGRMMDAADLAPVFAAAGVALDRPIVTTCGSGVTAAILLLALAVTGKTDVKLYDGSWSEWGHHPDLPVATGPA